SATVRIDLGKTVLADNNLAILVALQLERVIGIAQRVGAAWAQAVLVEATHHTVGRKPTGEEVLEERQLAGISIAATVTQVALQAQYPVTDQRLVVLGRVVQLVVLQVTARQGDLKGQLLERTIGRQLA